MSNIANLIYQTQASRPDLANSFIGGMQARQAGDMNRLKMQAAQAELDKESKLSGLVGQNITPEALFAAGFTDEAQALAKIKESGQSSFGVKDVSSLSKEVTPLLKGSQDVYNAAVSMEGLYERGTPASQMAAVFRFMKALDPTSAVRETEQGQVYSAEGGAKYIAAQLNKFMGEGGLSKENFMDLVGTSKALANSETENVGKSLDNLLSGYEGYVPDAVREAQRKRLVPLFDVSGQQKHTQKTEKTPKTAPPETNAKGWKIITDQNGNRAYVNPSMTEFEEIE